MTLINCKECNNKISHEAYSCPKCGWPVNDKYVKETLEKLRKEEEKKQGAIDKLLRKYFEDNKDKILLQIKKDINKINEKNRYKEIDKFLRKNYDYRPVLSCFSPLKKGGVFFTDGYQIFILKDEYLFADVAFPKDYTLKEKTEYLSKHNLFCKELKYPDIKSFIPEDKYIDKEEVEVDKFLIEREILKKIRKNKDDKLIYKINFPSKVVSCDANKVKTILDILVIKDIICFEYDRNRNYIVVRNKQDEIAVLLPIITY